MAKAASKSTLDRLLSRAVKNGLLVTASLREDIIEKLSGLYRLDTDFNTIVSVARDVLNSYQPLLAQVLSDTELAGWLLGADEVVKRIPSSVRDEIARQLEISGKVPIHIPTGLPPREPPDSFSPPAGAPRPDVNLVMIDKAVADLEARNIVTRDEFDSLEEDARRQAFTVAHQNSEETIEVIRDAMRDATFDGSTVDDFRSDLESRLGSSPMGEWHSELVFRQNIHQAYANGAEAIHAHPVVTDVLPFAAIEPIDDSRVRPTHLSLRESGLEGTNIYWASDEFWRIFSPPIEFFCRCGKRFMTLLQAAKAGLRLAQDILDAGGELPPINERESRLPFIDWRPDPRYVSVSVSRNASAFI